MAANACCRRAERLLLRYGLAHRQRPWHARLESQDCIHPTQPGKLKLKEQGNDVTSSESVVTGLARDGAWQDGSVEEIRGGLTPPNSGKSMKVSVDSFGTQTSVTVYESNTWPDGGRPRVLRQTSSPREAPGGRTTGRRPQCPRRLVWNTISGGHCNQGNLSS